LLFSKAKLHPLPCSSSFAKGRARDACSVVNALAAALLRYQPFAGFRVGINLRRKVAEGRVTSVVGIDVALLSVGGLRGRTLNINPVNPFCEPSSQSSHPICSRLSSQCIKFLGLPETRVFGNPPYRSFLTWLCICLFIDNDML